MLSVSFLVLLAACQKDPEFDDKIIKNTCGTPTNIKFYSYASPMPIPADNPTTEEGIELGRHLFYEKMLSGDNTQACASCHKQGFAFADNVKFSKGIDGFEGTRQAMPIFNQGYAKEFFWDGKANSLEEVMLFPIQSEIEMHESVFKAIKKLQQSDKYPAMFYAAFCDSTITVENTAKAMAQFMRSLVAYSPKMLYNDEGAASRSKAEQLGYEVFIDENKGDCFHCHTTTIFNTTYGFENNGLNADPTKDPGRFAQTGNPQDIGKFKVPSLLNVKYTAPYMHDGRFNTLLEVINFYDTGFQKSPTLSPNIAKHVGLNGKPKSRMTEQEKLALLYFLNRYSDTTLMTKPQYSDPN
ncbi:MAG: cytochrome-c peroxidase [Flavobacteriales bacterium]|nr:cytochrome-c peroxidase [Flavobacteriales bacterium]